MAAMSGLISRAGLENLGKGWIVRNTTTRRLSDFYSLPVAVWPTARHGPDLRHKACLRNFAVKNSKKVNNQAFVVGIKKQRAY